jgi:SAM-dependent methyltransferase
MQTRVSDRAAPLLDAYAKIASDGPNRKWLLKFMHPKRAWGVADFNNFIAIMRGYGDIKETNEPEVLEVTTNQGLYYEVTGVSAITHYCNYENCDVSQLQQYATLREDELPAEFADLTISSAVIERTPLVLDNSDGWDTTPKSYALVKRFSYETPHMRYTIAMIRRSKEESATMKASGVTGAAVTYEFAVEVINSTDVLQNATRMAQCLLNTPFPMTIEHTNAVIGGYEEHIINKVLPGVGRILMAPKPVTLERKNLLDPAKNYGVISILEGYTVTDKADGERMLMYIHEDGVAYLINNTFEVRSTGLRVRNQRLVHSLIDGEYITVDKRRDEVEKPLFAAFDIYMTGTENIINKPLFNGRYELLQAALDKSMWEAVGKASDAIELRVKTHIAAEGEAIFEACKKIWTGATKLPYEVDGLIFTPKDVPVFAYYPGRPVGASRNMRWNRVLKWKPSEQNTIDFYVEFGYDVVDRATRTTYRQIKLHTGYNATQWEPITVLHGLKIRYDKKYAREYYDKLKTEKTLYRFHLFKPITEYEAGVEIALLPVRNGRVVADNGDEITHQSIVEFAYKPSKRVPVSQRWSALRVREDKTRLLRTGETSKTANDLVVATNIWRSIHAPVTTDMIIGARHAKGSDAPDDLEERRLGVDDVYYARDIHTRHMLSCNMLYFHTHGIKKKLYNWSRRRDSLLELACGMAGDLPRWRECGYRFVLGVDSVRDNITNPSNGSYAQMLRQKREVSFLDQDGVEKTMYPDHVFVVGDCAYTLHDGEAANTLDQESRMVLQILYNNRHGQLPAYHLKNIAGKAAQGFDVVSSMFAIHYFFENRNTLYGFMNNVARNLKPGGIFIATYMDGESVDALLQGKSRGEAVEGRKLDGAVPVWAIVRDYDTLGNTVENGLGKRVGVYLENTRKVIPEYLVNTELLTKVAEEFGMELAETALFSKTFAELVEAIPPEHERKQLHEALLALKDDPIQTQFSFLNRWIIFRKK